MYPTRTYPKGHIFFEEGSSGTSAHMIKSGQVEITIQQEDKEIVVAAFGAGEMFGEMALLGAQTRTATARASEPIEVINISRAHLLKLLKNSDPILKHLVVSLVTRLRHANALIAGCQESSEDLDSGQALEDSEEYCRIEALVDGLDLNGKPQIRWVYRAPAHIKDSGKRLGVFSGSFNPLTIAHIKMIEVAQKKYDLDEILLILAKANVDKSVFGFSLADRLLMLKLYALSRGDFSVVACSHGRFIEKIQALKPAYPNSTHFVFIVGYDTLIRIFDPKYYSNLHSELETLFRQCRFVVANRKEHRAGAVKQFLEQPDYRCYTNRIGMIELPDLYAEISSTDIRTEIEQGNPIDHFVPPEVQEFLETKQAYQA